MSEGPAPARIARRRLRAAGTAVALLAAVGAAPAAGQLLGSEFQVNTHTTSYQNAPAIAAVGTGFLVVWDSDGQDGASRGVYAQHHDADAVRIGGEFRVNIHTPYAQGVAAVTGDSTGTFVVTWTSYQQETGFGAFAGIFARRGTSSATGSELGVNTYTTGDQKLVAAAADANGEVAIVWASQGQDGDDYGIYTQRFDASGAAIGGEQRVNSFTTDNQWVPAVAAVGSGEFVVVWSSYLNGQFDPAVDEIVARRVDATGAPVGPEIVVNQFTTGRQWDASVAADAAGNFVVAWESASGDGSGYGVFARHFDATGTPTGDQFQVGRFSIGEQRDPAVASDGDGFIVTWASQHTFPTGIFARRIGPDGVPGGTELRVSTAAVGGQAKPAIAPLGNDRFAVVWESNNQDGSGLGVHGRLLQGGLFIDGFEAADVCDWSATTPAVICP